MTLGIYGSGGLGREVLDLAKVINKDAQKWENIVFINDFKNENKINGADVYTFDEFKERFDKDNSVVAIAVGEPKIRQILREKVAQYGYELQTLIHPSAFIGSETVIGKGIVVQYGSVVSCNAVINDNVYIQHNAGIGHDCVIGKDTVISGGVSLSGHCVFGERVFVGIGVPVKENITIGDDSIIALGSAVLRDIPAGVIAAGNPARPMKKNEDNRVFKTSL